MFSYAAGASVKGPAENDVVNLMVEEILKDGFVTANEPLLLVQTDGLNLTAQEAGSEKKH